MFLSTLAAAETGDNFLQKTVQLGSFGPKVWHLILAIAIIVVLLVVLIVCIAKASKKGKRTKKANETAAINVSEEKTSDADREEVIETNGVNRSDYIRVSGRQIPELPEDEPVKERKEEAIPEDAPTVVERIEEPVAEEPAEAETVEDEPVEEKAEEVPEENTAEEPVAEAVEAQEETEPEVAATEEKQEEEQVKKEEKTVVKKETKKDVKKDVKKEPAKKEPVKKEEPKKAEAKVMGKFEICNSDLGGFNYLLRANNGQLLYESKEYKSKDSCREAIENFIVAVKDGRFAIRADKFKNYKFVLKSPTSNQLIYIGESFSTESSCKNNVESVKRFATSSTIVDITKEDFVAKFVPYEIPKEIVKAVNEKSGAVGKWVIEQVEEDVKNSPYVFLLYANNGQLLYESRDYKTAANCLSGLNTFVSTVKTGVFAIDPDKSGRFKFVLRGNSANSSMEYYGQNYDTKKGCANSIDSVYKFALLSPLPEK